MTSLIKNNTTLNSLREMGNKVSFLTAVLVMVVGLTAGATQAQDPEVGNSGGWRAEKTVDDYMNSSDGSQAKRTDADFDYAGNTLRAEVWVDKAENEIYRKGQDIGVGFETNQDAYAVVYRIDTDGLVTILWPRSRFDDGFIFGSHEYQLPVSGARKLRVSTSEGQGIVEAVVSQYPFDLRALELDFHHEHTAERYDFRVAGDPFLAMNEVNYAVTGLEDSGEYVVTNYASYYVHQEVDHPRYLCNQCHIEDEVAYDPYRDECTLDIEYDYSWYNGWYDNYGYYPVYGNPVYVYIDPWNYNPWVNYWYRPYYSCAPWYGWGWGYGSAYSWNYSPYYYGDCVTVYSGGNTRYRPLDRTRTNGSVTKTREYGRGSEMVGKNSLSSRERGVMSSRSRGDERTDRSTTVGRNSTSGRSGGRDVAYRGAEPASRNRSSFVQSSSTGRSQGGLRIRETGNSSGTSRGTATDATRRRHTAAGDGQRAGLVPVTRSSRSNDDWRGTSRVSGSSGTRGTSNTSTTVGNSRNTGSSSSSSSSSGVQNSRSRSSGTTKTVQPRKRSTRVWNSTGSESGSSRESSRSRSGTVDNRRRSDSSSSTRTNNSSTVRPRTNTKSSSSSSSSKSTGRSSGTVNKRSSSSSKSSSSSGSSRSGSSSSGGSSRSSSGGGSSKSSSRSGSSRR